MALFTDTALAPKVYLGTDGINTGWFLSGDTSLEGYTRTTSTVTYELRGLADTTAAASATYWSTLADSISAIASRVSEGGSYNVIITTASDTITASA